LHLLENNYKLSLAMSASFSKPNHVEKCKCGYANAFNQYFAIVNQKLTGKAFPHGEYDLATRLSGQIV